MKYETLDGPDVDRIMRGDNLTKPPVGDYPEKGESRRTIVQPGVSDNEPHVNPGLGGGPLPAPG
jgi:hypothetical protein